MDSLEYIIHKFEVKDQDSPIELPIDKYGGTPEWREGVQDHHARRKERRRQQEPAIEV